MKKILFLVLALSTIITFASCEDKEPSKVETSSKETESSIEASMNDITEEISEELSEISQVSEESSEKAEEYGEYGKKISEFFSNTFEKNLVVEEKTFFGMSAEGARAYVYSEDEKIHRVECTFYGDSGCTLYLYAILDETATYCIVVDTDYSYTYDDEKGIVEWDNVNVEKTAFHYIIENGTTVYEYNVETGNIGNVVEDKRNIIEDYETIITIEDGGNPSVPSSSESNE